MKKFLIKILLSLVVLSVLTGCVIDETLISSIYQQNQLFSARNQTLIRMTSTVNQLNYLKNSLDRLSK